MPSLPLDVNKFSTELVGFSQGQALNAIEKASLKENMPECYHALRAEVFLRELRVDRAILEIEKSININKDWAASYNIRANIKLELAQYVEALQDFNRAILLDPISAEFRFNRGQLNFLLGNWEAGKKDYEFHLNSHLFRAPTEIDALPLWDGTVLPEKRLLAYWEQGLGDTIQFVRFAEILLQRGMDVILEVQESLKSLIAYNFPKATVLGPQDPLPPFEIRAPIPSLPWLMGTLPETVYAPISYLSSPLPSVLPSVSSMMRVGIVWAGNPQHVNDKQRSIPFSEILALTQIPNITFYSLQVGSTKIQRKDMLRAGVIDLSTELSDFSSTAAFISELDLVITVDTSVAHLAGALGKPVWVLLPFVPDWRWMLDRSDNLWYPSARLFRQPGRGAWRDLIESVRTELRRLVADRMVPSDLI